MANKESKTENCTILNGVVLTDALLETIKEFQANDNEVLCKLMLENISDTICLFAKNLDYWDHDKEAILTSMNQLAWMRENLKNLKKP